MVMHKKRSIEVHLEFFLLSLTCLSAMSLTLPSVFADESTVDVVTINVSSSCTLSATGTGSHTATVGNGQTVSDIGTTNLNVICNDNSGYAIYAIGYTDDVHGKTVLTNPALGSANDIITASSVTAGTSSWAMKLASTAGTYTPTIVSDYASYHAVPEEYTKVAYYAASTDAGANAVGSSLSTTYRAYVSQTQPAGRYVGQVKYTLVHPNGEFPMPNNLVGVTLRFNEEIDLDSISAIIPNVHYYDDHSLRFAVKMTVADVCVANEIYDSSIATWSQLVDALPDYLASLGATNIQSDMEIINKDQDYAYVEYYGLLPWSQYSDGNIDRLDFWENGYARWSYLPAAIGQMSFTIQNESYSFSSLEELLMWSGYQAWLGEAYSSDYQWGIWPSDPPFRTITIYGGSDATDPTFIQWLSDNATLLYIEDSPANKTWTFNEYAPSDSAMRWDVSGSIYSNSYTAYHFDYIIASTAYGVPYWTFYYYDATEPYTAGDGFIYLPEGAVIPEYNIDYPIGWGFGNINNPTQFSQVSPPTITLQGGEDLYNPAFMSWLRENATSN
jgi:hypothetical protein